MREIKPISVRVGYFIIFYLYEIYLNNVYLRWILLGRDKKKVLFIFKAGTNTLSSAMCGYGSSIQ